MANEQLARYQLLDSGHSISVSRPSMSGTQFLSAAESERPLQCVGAVNAYHALLAEACGFNALYLSGGGVAASSCGLPDLGVTTMDDVLTDLRRITDVTTLPVLVDIDTGWGGAFNIALRPVPWNGPEPPESTSKTSSAKSGVPPA